MSTFSHFGPQKWEMSIFLHFGPKVHFCALWVHLGPFAPPPSRGAAWAVDGWLGEDGGGGQGLAGQPAVPDRGSAGLR